MKKILLMAMSIGVLVGCGGSSSTTSTSTTAPATAAIAGSTNLTAFTFHSATAYYASFGDAGVTLSAATSASTAGDIASYRWEQISGPTVTMTSADTTSATLEFTVPAITAMLHASEAYRWQVLPISRDDYLAEFRVTVTDAAGNTDKETFTVYLFDNGSEIHISGGQQNVGIAEKIYLSGPSLHTDGATIADWTWTLTVPAGSSATFTDSGIAVSTLQVASFTPDVAGTYSIVYATASLDDDDEAIDGGTLTVNVSSYVGVGTVGGTTADSSLGQCANCHADEEGTWDDTGHSVQFEQVISYYQTRAPSPYCWECHTVGYNTSADGNGGFDDLATAAGYAFPSDGTTWDAFVADNPTVAPLANIQCENCHGPGGSHLGTTTDSKIYHSAWSAGVCGRCHHQEAEWKISGHNSSSGNRIGIWAGESCSRCHSSHGFIHFVENGAPEAQENIAVGGTDFIGVGCAACHDPHSQAGDAISGSTAVSGNDSTQLRLKGNVTMKDDAATVVNAGRAAVCYTCHDGNYTYLEFDCDADGDGTSESTCDTSDQIATQYKRQIHGNPQSMVLEGLGAIDDEWTGTAYDFTLTDNSWHSSDDFTFAKGSGDSSLSTENNKCVTCHMGTAPDEEEEGYRLVGGHTWKMNNGEVEFLASCQTCHTGLTTHNRSARADYDGDGTVEGIQDEIAGLLLALSTKILALDATNVSGGTTEADGVITVGNLSSYSSQTTLAATNIDVRRATYNHNLISKDGSLGVHNAGFAVQVLQRTYSAVSQIHGGNSFATDYPNAAIR